MPNLNRLPNPKRMDEFDFIARYLKPLSGPQGLNLLDDAAVYSPPSGFDLVLTKDTMVEGVHFPNRHWGADTAEKLLRVNLSDLAAKGARPAGYLLSIAWPKSVDKEVYFKAFVKGLQTVQEAFDFSLFGGDTVSIDGPMVVSATLMGLVPKGEMVTRSGAEIGDDVWVSGTIGDAALGLKLVLGEDLGMSPSGAAIWTWEEAYFRPVPRLALRKLLRKYANACADISDGLISDVTHIANASRVGIEIDLNKIPVSDASQSWVKAHKINGLEALITAGDDYELAFLAKPKHADAIQEFSKQNGVVLTRIGSATEGVGVRVLNPDGSERPLNQTGFKHF